MPPKGHIDFIPDNKTQNEALNTFKKLSVYAEGKQELQIQLLVNKQQEKTNIKLSAPIAQLLLELLEEIAAGHPLSILSLQKEISTQQGADLLNVSRPFFVKLLESGAIPFHKVGKHRRANAADVLAYKEKFMTTSDKAITKLVEQAQDLDMDYDIDE